MLVTGNMNRTGNMIFYERFSYNMFTAYISVAECIKKSYPKLRQLDSLYHFFSLPNMLVHLKILFRFCTTTYEYNLL